MRNGVFIELALGTLLLVFVVPKMKVPQRRMYISILIINCFAKNETSLIFLKNEREAFLPRLLAMHFCDTLGDAAST